MEGGGLKSVFWMLGVVMVIGGDFYTYNFNRLRNK
jgi:hypothetical protein